MSEADRDLQAVLEILAQEERADLDQAHGEHILGMVGDTPERRETQNRALLDAIHQTTEPGDDAA